MAERGSSEERWAASVQRSRSRDHENGLVVRRGPARSCADPARLDNDAGVCTRSNPLAFEKLHTLAKAHYLLRDRAAGVIGEQGAQQAVDQAVSELIQKFTKVRGG